MVDISKLKIGQKVHYAPSYMKENGEYENGIVKEIPEHSITEVRVVYNCDSDWKRFMEYTSALTIVSDLYMGWKHDTVEN